jgi:hypothetical protein
MRPPTIGAASRFMTSAPDPVGPEQRHQADKHGRDGHQLGPDPLDRAFHVRGDDVIEGLDPALPLAALERVIDKDDHHDAGLCEIRWSSSHKSHTLPTSANGIDRRTISTSIRFLNWHSRRTSAARS